MSRHEWRAHRTGWLTLLALVAVATAGCASLKQDPVEPVHEAGALVRYLDGEGIRLMYTGASVREEFSEPAHTFQVMSGGTLAIIEYKSDMSAWMDAPRIDRPMGNGPHFYHRDNLIVVYFGDDPSVERVLSLIMGSRVA